MTIFACIVRTCFCNCHYYDDDGYDDDLDGSDDGCAGDYNLPLFDGL